MSTEYPRILPVGGSAAVVEFGDRIDPAINREVYRFAASLENAAPAALTELVPTYRSLLVHYDADRADYATMVQTLEESLKEGAYRESAVDRTRAQLFELPVRYGGDDGPDLPTVAERAGLSTAEVIRIHSDATYQVYMLGFLPGFPYLGGMDERIACPRLTTPRVRVPAGSVGIAESQTGVYPMDSPGGWRLIGRTPAPLFDPDADPPAAILPGSFIRFVPIEESEMARVERAIAEGEYALPESEFSP